MNILLKLLVFFTQLLLSLRYKVTYSGLDLLKERCKKYKNGILFLPNHPAVVVDPLIVSCPLLRDFQVRPLVVEYMYYAPVFHTVLKAIGALAIPNFSTGFNPIKLKKTEKLLNDISDSLKKGSSFLIYPSGTTKRSSLEKVGGAFGVSNLIQQNPECGIVLVRIEGLWGSAFSRAQTGGKPVDTKKALQKGFWTLLKNGIFFAPRREVTVTFELQEEHELYKKPKEAINHYFESWYNKPYPVDGEPLKLVSYSFYKNELPQIPKVQQTDFDLTKVSQEVRDVVDSKLSELSKIPKQKIRPGMLLFEDLGLDSLDIAELITFLEVRFSVSYIEPEELSSVTRIYQVASGNYSKKEPVEKKHRMSRWNKKRKKEKLSLYSEKSILDAFFAMCSKNLFKPIAADPQSGIFTGYRLKKSLLLLTAIVRTYPEKRVGVLLPSSTASYLVILSLLYAKKTPVMVNWTVGGKHLETVCALSEMKAVISSWAFLDKLENVDLSIVEPYLSLLEEEKVKLSLFDLIFAHFKALFPLKAPVVASDDEAVLLFTSGTERAPKAVPLSQKNIMENISASLEEVKLYKSDTLLAFLPPFHSFGFTITGLLPLLTGLKTVFYPNPTDSLRLQRAIDSWGVTVLCSAPSFLKNILATADVYNNMRLIITGAEKAHDDLRELLKKKTPHATFCEGYGITECSPVLTINMTGDKEKGVGKPLSNLDIAIVDPEKLDREMPPGKVGMIVASGPSIFSGYLNRDVKSPFIIFSGKTWYETGDLGYLTADNNLIISGRLKRFVKIGGEMISLGAIEETLQEVFGKENSEVVEFCIQPKSDLLQKPTLTLFSIYDLDVEEVNQALRKHGFSNLAKIDTIQTLDAIPVTATGKISYAKLDEL